MALSGGRIGPDDHTLHGGELLEGEEYMMGIDEAGRGPVLGNMTYGAALCPIGKEQETKDLGFVDSKKLDDKKRQVLFKKIKETPWLLWHVCSISPISISNAMMRKSKKYSLNAMSHDCAIGMVNHMLSRGVNITQLYVDTVGVESYYQEKLQKLFPSMKAAGRPYPGDSLNPSSSIPHCGGRFVQIVVCKKCDDIYPICSAASICAKVTRDEETENWNFPEPSLQQTVERNWGSGYPGDAKCKEWLMKNYDPVFAFPSFARFSWSTVKDLSEEMNGVKVEWKDEDDEDPQQLALSFVPNKKRKRHRFFNERKVQVVESF